MALKMNLYVLYIFSIHPLKYLQGPSTLTVL